MKEQLLNLVATSRKYTLDVADAMPADKYETKPVEGVWNFKELLHHVAYGIEWWGANYVRRKETAWEPTAMSKDKKTVFAYLESAYDGLEKSIKELPMDESAVRGVHATLDHVTHHRGQAVLHLRGQGEDVPEYTY